MKQDKQDRRSQRTQRLVNSAMMELVFEKPYAAISVQDILDRAGIGRSTFYTHYFDKEDVLTSIADQMLEMFSQQFSQRNEEQGLIPCLELFEHVQQNYHNFRSMLRGHAGEVVWEAAQAALSRTIEQALINASMVKSSPGVPLPVVAQYLAGSFLNLLKWWLRAEMPYTPEHMESIFQQLALPGVWATVKEKSDPPPV